MCLATSLGHREGDESKLPSWCAPRQAFPFRNAPQGEECPDRAVEAAIQSALQAVDVAPEELHRSWSGKEIGRVSVGRAGVYKAAYRLAFGFPPSA